MAVSLSQYAGAGAQFFDNNGNPLAGGLIYTYAAGTTTPAATYTTYTGGTANANPIVLDSAGRTPAQIWLTSGSSYKFVLQTSLGVTIKTDDNIFASFELAKEIGIAVGLGAGSVATNIAVGDTALDSNTTGANNTAVGYNALTSNTDGIQNVAVGSQALDAATTSNNTAVGASALGALTSGANNVALGFQAGDSLTTGSNNIVIGYDADGSAVGVSNEITLGNSSITSMRVPGLTMTVGAKWINNGTQTVAALVAAGTAGAGARAVVTDASATTFHSIVAGGGANVVPVFSDGTNWRIG